MTFTTLDTIVLIILLGSIVVSILRGFFRELIGLVGWVVAFVLAGLYGADAAVAMPEAITVPALRLAAGYVTVFLITLLVANIINWVIDSFLRATSLKPVDRLLGAVFGFIRGALILMGLVVLAGFTQLPKQPVWTNSITAPALVWAVQTAKPLLPAALSSYIKF
jgi:membrane protein required for colicin V production